ncbi:MAG: hypothetical protein ABI871_08320 [Chthoniobacterales bacterium]
MSTPIEHHFHLVLGGRIGRLVESMRGGYNSNRSISSQQRDYPIDQLRIYQRFVALDVDDVTCVPASADHVGDTIGATPMTWRGERNLGAPGEGCLGNAHIISGDDQRIERFGTPTSFPDVL